MKKHITKIGAIVLATTLALGTLFLAPKAGKVRAADFTFQEDFAGVEWEPVSGQKDGTFFSDFSNAPHSENETVTTRYIKLSGNTEIITTRWTQSSGTIYLDLNGKTLSSNIKQTSSNPYPHIIDLSGTANLCIFDSSTGGKIVHDTDGNTNASQIIRARSKNYIELRSGTLEGGNCSVKASGGVVFTMKGGKITGSTFLSGSSAAVYLEGSTFIMTGGEISNNSGMGNGGALYLKDNTSNAYLSNATLANNKSKVDNGTLSGEGGAIYLNGGTCEILGGCSITTNEAKKGSGVYVLKGTLKIKGNNTISGNVGDNVYLEKGKQITIDGTVSGTIGVKSVATTLPYEFTTGTSLPSDSTVFFSDDATRYVGVVNGKAKLKASVLAGCQLLLKGNIGVRYYFDLSSLTSGEIASSTFTFNDTEVPLSGPMTVNSKSYYYCDMELNAAQMMTPISGVANLGNGDTIPLKTITIQSVAQAIINSNDVETNVNTGADNQKYKDLATAMLDYGARVQQYFQLDANNLPITPTDFSSNSEINTLLGNSLYTWQSLDANMSFYGSSMLTLTRSTMRLYFKLESSAGKEYSFDVNGTTLTPAPAKDINGQLLEDQYYYVALTDIAPRAYDTAITVTINGNLSISYSPLNYCARALVSTDSTPALKALARSMCNYYLKAAACPVHE